MASGGTRVAAGQYEGTGVAFNLIGSKVGFKPKYVLIMQRDTAIDMAQHVAGMPDASFYQTIGADGVRTLVASNGITLLATGFTVGTDAQINTAAKTYDYVAFE